jgi:hypothetical protein
MTTSTLAYQAVEVSAPSLEHYADFYDLRIVDYNASTCNSHSDSFQSGSSRPICGFVALNCIRLVLKLEAEGLLDIGLVQRLTSSSMNDVSFFLPLLIFGRSNISCIFWSFLGSHEHHQGSSS